jgi:endonuclease/exonuclease/phosphatase family metal-dependent hydrolase
VPRGNNRTLRLLQTNIWFKEKLEKIAPGIALKNPDIVTAQEVCRYGEGEPEMDMAREIARVCGFEDNYYFQPAHRWTRPRNNQPKELGNAIFSRFPLVNKRWRPIRESVADPLPESDNEGRIVIMADLMLPNNRRITVATSHLSWRKGNIDDKPKLEEVDCLLCALAENSGPLVFTADTNSEENGPVFQKLLTESNLADAGPQGHGTWPKESVFGFQALQLRFDIVLATPDIEIVSSETVDLGYSDHLAVLTTFRLRVDS